MGLEEGELPSYIQKMHQLGYPPGWKALHEDILKMFVDPGHGLLLALSLSLSLSLSLTLSLSLSLSLSLPPHLPLPLALFFHPLPL